MNTAIIETKRLLLRKFDKDDIEAIYRIYSDKEVNTFLPWFVLKDINEAKQLYKEQFESQDNQEIAYHYAICLKENNIPIGYIHVNMDESHDFGYALCKEFWHKGIVTEASKAVIQQLKNDGILYITATHDVKNYRSGEVMRRLGMKYQYSYEEQWQPKDFPVIFRMYQLNFDDRHDFVYNKYRNMHSRHFIERLP